MSGSDADHLFVHARLPGRKWDLSLQSAVHALLFEPAINIQCFIIVHFWNFWHTNMNVY